MNKFYVFAVLLGFLLSSCSSRLTPFTQRMYDDFTWTQEDLKRIQFYVSKDIRLWRDISTTDESYIEEGKVRLVNGRNVEEVVIKKGTPGVLLFAPKENRFAIGFDDKEDNFLMFGPNKRSNGKYKLLAKEWGRSTGKITYNGQTYNVSSDDAYAGLMIDIKSARKRSYNSTRPDGRKVR